MVQGLSLEKPVVPNHVFQVELVTRIFVFLIFSGLLICCLLFCPTIIMKSTRKTRRLTRNSTVHQFFVRANTRVVKPKPHKNVELAADPDGQVQRYRVFGMTARIIVDAARVAYDQEPEFEHNSHFGDEAMIAKLRRLGRLNAVRRRSDQLTRETMERAAKLS
jgi:hypothetical protein